MLQYLGHLLNVKNFYKYRRASPRVLGSIPGAGNSLAARYRSLSKAVKCKKQR
jgi:hypothetical protein